MSRFLGAVPEEIEALEKFCGDRESKLIDGMARWQVLQNIEKKRRNRMKIQGYIYLGFALAIICYLCSGFIF